MELRHLRYFVAVAEELHFGRAAARLSLAQPPLSQQIRQLEKHLDVELFYRTTRQVVLTEAGRHFLEYARRILNQVEDAKHSARRVHNGEFGRLMLSFLSSTAGTVVPMLLREYHQCYPDVEIILQEVENSTESLIVLKAGAVHASVLRPPVDDKELDHEVLISEPFVVALPDNHRLAKRRWISLPDLATEPFVVFRRRSGTALYDGIISQCNRAGFSPRVVSEMASVASINCLVAAGVGVSFLPASAAMLQTAGVTFVKLRTPGHFAPLAIAWRRDEHAPVLKSFLEVARHISATPDRLTSRPRRAAIAARARR